MLSSKRKAEGTAAQAWDYLSSAMAAAGETAKHTAEMAGEVASKAGGKSHQLAGKAGRKRAKMTRKAGKKGQYLVGSASHKADEAWARANAAAAALAGRRPGRPWGLIASVALVGIAIGWAAASSARAVVERQAEEEELELANTAVVVTPAREV
jgi:hypothetical protein